MDIREFIKSNTVILDGSMGTLLQSEGLGPGEHPGRWNISHPDVITGVHRAYFDAGTNIVCTNTFGVNSFNFSSEEIDAIISAAVKNARKAAETSSGTQQKFVSLDIGPTGKLLKPYGEYDFETITAVFAETVKLGVKYKVDCITVETMNDSLETKAALLAVKENSDLPVLVMNSYGQDGRLMTGADPLAMIALLEGMGADAIGINCSLGPEELKKVAHEYLKYASIPVIFKPNAGIPLMKDGKTVYTAEPEAFAAIAAELFKQGLRMAGGCCGTSPEYIQALCNKVKGIEPAAVEDKNMTLASSGTHAVNFDDFVIIGERINPTGRKAYRQALAEGDMNYALKEAVKQEDEGADILDVNAGMAGIDEVSILKNLVEEIQSVTSLPLQIDSSDPKALEAALRVYNGKAVINSVNGSEKSMKSVFPLVKKYGGVLIALTLDENGIPDTPEGRLGIAERIILKAEEYGIKKKDIIFDPLTMAVGADIKAAITTLESVELITRVTGCKTVLGISNVSHGLPGRKLLNSVFLMLAKERGLSSAICNPAAMPEAVIDDTSHAYAENALYGRDAAFAEYIAYAQGKDENELKLPDDLPEGETVPENLMIYIGRGLKEEAATAAKKLLQKYDGMSLINDCIIPALTKAGEKYSEGSLYLPQLLMCAEAAGEATDVIRQHLPQGESKKKNGKILLATVEGDIHDIGKNIVKMLLESHGFNVKDLGRDVAAEKVLSEAGDDVAIVGLSSLMTTTVPAMGETVRLLKERRPEIRIVVGGAVLTQDDADRMGADFYSADAMDTVRYAQSLIV